MIEMNTQQLDELLSSGEKVMLMMSTPSCGGCKVLGYQLEAVEEELDLPVVKVNAEANEKLAARFQIMKVPQMIIVENNEEVKRHNGFLPSEEIVKFVGTSE